MRLATARDGSRDGELLVIRRDGEAALEACDVARSLQDALDRWEEVLPSLRALSATLDAGDVDGIPLDPGSLHPFAFPILSFQPRAGLVHLPPTWHGTFAAPGVLVCSFVPRVLDFHPEAVPCPYPHASVDVDEVLFYVRGEFTSRRGVGPGSISHHPAGTPHGPHPGAYEASLGVRTTDELAVMLDCQRPLAATQQAVAVEDPGYQDSFVET